METRKALCLVAVLLASIGSVNAFDEHIMWTSVFQYEGLSAYMDYYCAERPDTFPELCKLYYGGAGIAALYSSPQLPQYSIISNPATYEAFDHFSAHVTVPEDLKLVSSEGLVVGDEVCVGDRFGLQKGVRKGEFWNEGGDIDSPPIYWVDDVEEFSKNLVKQALKRCEAGMKAYTTQERKLIFSHDSYGFLIPADNALNNLLEYLRSIGRFDAADELAGSEFSIADLSPHGPSNPDFDVIKNGEKVALIHPKWIPLQEGIVWYLRLADGSEIPFGSGYTDVCLILPDGYIDKSTGIPVYEALPLSYNTSDVYPTEHMYLGTKGAVVCGLKDKGVNASGVSYASGYYTALKEGTIDFNQRTDLECAYYLYVASGPPIANLTENRYKEVDYELRAPCIPCPDSSIGVCYLFSPEPYADLWSVGALGLSKTIRVVSPANSKVDVSVPSASKLILNQPNVLRVLVKNSGDVDVDLSDVRSNAVHKFVSCDAKTVSPGETAECLIEITPQVGEGVSVNVNYGYRTCGRAMKGVASKEVLSSQVVKASSMSQVYALDVSGGCVNRYYVCNSALEQQWFSLGFKCSTKEANKYIVSSLERIDLGFGLPALPEGAQVAGARLGLTASGASKAQDVSVYSVPSWSTVFCVPGGDICAKPSCEECAPLFDLSGRQLGTTNVAGPGKYFVDVTDAVKQAYQNKDAKVSLQLRGKEDFGADTGSCGAGKDWTRYDLNFRGKVDASYLEIVYAK